MKALHKLTDALLADRARAGDTDAFEMLFRRYAKKVYRFVFFRTRREADVDDIVNDVFLSLWEVLQSGTKIDNVRAYVYKITRNKVIDYYRTRKEHFDIDTVEIEADIDLEAAINTDVDIAALLDSLDQLHETYREVLQLRYVDDLDIQEIATVLDKSPGAVKVQIHRAIQQLKSQHTQDE